MAEDPITSEQFHTELVNLVAEVAAKAIRGDTGSYEGMSWDDADRFIKLVMRLGQIEFHPGYDRAGNGEYRLVAELIDRSNDDVEELARGSASLSETVLKSAEIVREDEHEASGAEVAYVKQNRERIMRSVGLLDEWIAKNGG